MTQLENNLVKVVNITVFGSLSRGWPRAWDRLTRTVRTFIETIADLIDNPAAEMRHFGPIDIDVTIGGKWVGGVLDLETAWLRVRDNGPGMPIEQLEQCLALAEKTRENANSLHEHGVGMKTALVTFGRSVESIRHIVTKRKTDEFGYRFSYYEPGCEFGSIPVRRDDVVFKPEEHGTEIYIVGLSEKGVYKRRQDYTQHVVDQLGFKYARLLSGQTMDGHKMSLRFRLCHEDGSPFIGKNGEIEADWQIEPVVQRYRGAAPPKIDNQKLSRSGEENESYQALLTFGLAAQEEEYNTAGLAPPSPKHPCHQFKRQIHVVSNGKVITSLNIGDFGGDPNSNTYVPYTGVLTLISGFSTTYEKNGIVNSENWDDLRRRVYGEIQPLIVRWAQERPQEQKALNQRERRIRDAYAERLRLPLPGSGKIPAVDTEYTIEGSAGRIDIFYKADSAQERGLVIEIKPDVANSLDVMQAYSYVFLAQTAIKTRCQLVAVDFSTGAKVTARRLAEELGVVVELVTVDELNLGVAV